MTLFDIIWLTMSLLFIIIILSEKMFEGIE